MRPKNPPLFPPPLFLLLLRLSKATDRSIDENDDGEKKTNARSVLTNTLPFSLFLSHPIQQRCVARRNDETRRPVLRDLPSRRPCVRTYESCRVEGTDAVEDIWADVEYAISETEKELGKKFGGEGDAEPLLFSVRSGSYRVDAGCWKPF